MMDKQKGSSTIFAQCPSTQFIDVILFCSAEMVDPLGKIYKTYYVSSLKIELKLDF